jgi:hypothetical protein
MPVKVLVDASQLGLRCLSSLPPEYTSSNKLFYFF